MEQEAKSIYEFRKGDVITLIKPTEDPDGRKDYILVGKKFIFLGIANASVYLSRELDSLSKMLFNLESHTIQLPVELYENGWAYYIDPEILDNVDSSITENEYFIQDKINEAIKKDNFEEAEFLKRKLQELKKKGK